MVFHCSQCYLSWSHFYVSFLAGIVENAVELIEYKTLGATSFFTKQVNKTSVTDQQFRTVAETIHNFAKSSQTIK